MSEGILLLSKNGCYVDMEGRLPSRPKFDKDFLLAMVKGKRCLASVATFQALPLSIVNASASITSNPEAKWDINLGIATYGSDAGLPDVMFIVKSDEELENGIKFRFDKFELLYKTIYESEELKVMVKT